MYVYFRVWNIIGFSDQMTKKEEMILLVQHLDYLICDTETISGTYDIIRT